MHYAHSFTTIATAGFSTKNESIAFFRSVEIEMVIMVFMILSALPYILYIMLIRGQFTIFSDWQVRTFLIILFGAISITTIYLVLHEGYSIQYALRIASFNITSILTTTGFSSADYSTWGSFILVFIFLIMSIGGCTGSTTGGIKIFRIQILFKTAKLQIKRLIYPHIADKLNYNREFVSDIVITSVTSYIIIFGFMFCVLSGVLGSFWLRLLKQFKAVQLSIISNLGPALGNILGPAGNFLQLR